MDQDENKSPIAKIAEKRCKEKNSTIFTVFFKI